MSARRAKWSAPGMIGVMQVTAHPVHFVLDLDAALNAVAAALPNHVCTGRANKRQTYAIDI
jgi:hypothetical protein